MARPVPRVRRAQRARKVVRAFRARSGHRVWLVPPALKVPRVRKARLEPLVRRARRFQWGHRDLLVLKVRKVRRVLRVQRVRPWLRASSRIMRLRALRATTPKRRSARQAMSQPAVVVTTVGATILTP